jgi:hypothetical protein
MSVAGVRTNEPNIEVDVEMLIRQRELRRSASPSSLGQLIVNGRTHNDRTSTRAHKANGSSSSETSALHPYLDETTVNVQRNSMLETCVERNFNAG